MTELRIEQTEMPAAELGPENPLPVFRDPKPDTHPSVQESVPESDRTYLGWQCANRILPHRMQDSYGRQKTPRKFTAATLENEHLRAVVLPEMGGRLISLLHKPSGRELLEPVLDIQFTNIALRNAWIAGGVEWNTAQLGHHYLTCSPMFAARVRGTQGEPVLRLYAWERTKRFPYQIDLHLAPGSGFLFVRVRIVNPHDEVLPMYWWTNIAVPEALDRRVIAPADTAIHNHPEGLAVTDVPILDGRDLTYSTNHPYAKEFFFRIEPPERPWVASLDGSGAGLIHASTARLRGRKMFVWGTERGGQKWQEHLLGPGRAYLEIQGGLARTQLESIPMPAKTEWTWTEAFGLLQADPAQVHSHDWSEARGAVARQLEEMLPLSGFDRLDAALADVTSRPPEEIIFRGDGWGALESLRGGYALPELPFPEDCLGADQQPWLSLLREGVLPARDPSEGPGHYMVQPEWQSLLEDSISRGKSDHWLGWLHLGVMRLENGDPEGAKTAWQRSIDRTPSAWAYRNLAMLTAREGDENQRCELLKQAWGTACSILSLSKERCDLFATLAVECAQALEKTQRWDELRDFIASLPDPIRDHDRILMISARLALRYDDLSQVEQILSHDFATIREGETTLTDLWFIWQAKLTSEREGLPMSDDLIARMRQELTPPLHLDMRMAGEKK